VKCNGVFGWDLLLTLRGTKNDISFEDVDQNIVTVLDDEALRFEFLRVGSDIHVRESVEDAKRIPGHRPNDPVL
jgi:hypothetical protein